MKKTKVLQRITVEAIDESGTHDVQSEQLIIIEDESTGPWVTITHDNQTLSMSLINFLSLKLMMTQALEQFTGIQMEKKVGELLFDIHSHAELCNPEEVVYKHSDIVRLFEMLGFSTDYSPADVHVPEIIPAPDFQFDGQEYGMVILYEPNYKEKSLQEIKRTMILPYGVALEAYCEIPNPASQIIKFNSEAQMNEELAKLEANVKDPKWIKHLFNSI